jgi:dethiobiotin synthetase
VKNTYFITGTDTDVGKTYVSCALLNTYKHYKTLGLKPIASGAKRFKDQLYNDDALKLMSCSTLKYDYQQVNPFVFEPPIAPHIAALKSGIPVTTQDIMSHLHFLHDTHYDLCLIEGAGGWRVPLNNREDLSDIAIQLHVPVILVVGMKLGCISHARLTAESIVASGAQLAGWIANCIDPNMRELHENIATLKNRLPAPMLATLPYQAQGKRAHPFNISLI